MTGVIWRRRDDGALELRVNGVFVMDDIETASERALARQVLDAGARQILVGGLGLGYTTRELLADPGVERVLVAELHREIVDWMRDGEIPGADLLDDPRLEVVIGDVRDVVRAQPPHGFDAIVLDTDNGPGFLVHDTNAAVYGADFAAECAKRLRPGGRLSIWSMAPSSELLTALTEVFDHVAETSIPVCLQGRDEHYWIVTGADPR